MATDTDYSSFLVAGKYLIQDLVGSGAMSVVYRGIERTTGKLVAVKIMKRCLIDDEEIVTRFLREIRTCMSLTHSNIVKVLDGGRLSTGEPYLIMEYLQGRSMAELLESTRMLKASRALNIVCQAADGLSEAHKRGYIHRDIKPQNLMVVNSFTQRDRVKVLDFGVAKLGDSVQKIENFSTAPGNVLGTPLYMSPEQILGNTIDGRSDIYSLGCVLYQSLCGKHAVAGTNAIEVMQNHLEGVPPHLNYYSVPIRYPDELNALVQKCLAKDPEDRYKSMAEFAAAIRKYMTPPLVTKLCTILNIDTNKSNSDSTARHKSKKVKAHKKRK